MQNDFNELINDKLLWQLQYSGVKAYTSSFINTLKVKSKNGPVGAPEVQQDYIWCPESTDLVIIFQSANWCFQGDEWQLWPLNCKLGILAPILKTKI